jgi:hypothetical protein
MQTWSTSDDRITEISIPVTFIIPVSKRLTLSAMTNSAMAKLTSAENNLNGLTDSRISGTYLTPDNHFLFTAGVTAPTGKTRLEGDQASVASALAMYPLSFDVPSFGQGLSVNISGVCAYQVDNYILGGGLAFVYKDGFKPYVNSDTKYKPGTELSINVGGETNAKNRGPVKFTLDLTYTIYGADKFDGTEVFKSGGKFIGIIRSLFQVSKTDLMFYALERTKGRNDRGIGSLITEDRNSNGNQLEFGGISYTPMSSKFGLKGVLDLKLYSKNAYEMNGALIAGFGAGFNYYISNSLTLDLLFKYSAGTLSNKGESNSVTGIEIGGGIKFTL